MAHSRRQMEEIRALLPSHDKALAYSKLLHFQEIATVDSSAMEILADSCRAILSSIVFDIANIDEEIAAQALKCLGFMIYHPNIVASIGGDDADVIIQSLVNVISVTKIKSVCNLGVWCISIQQFSPSLLDHHLKPLISAVTHALDNPIGSLSITFEAMQAVVKLACSLTEQMKDVSSLWAPPIYRRLVSMNKMDRDMSERCLLKIVPLICPPPISLSKVPKAIAVDMKKYLTLAVKELLDQGMKIQSLQAWRWFILLLGPYGIKNKHLINEMLKILEQTFSDFNYQVQIASLVAWEGLIDALIEPAFLAGLTNSAVEDHVQVLNTSECNNTTIKEDRHLKRIKLIMAPIIRIMSSKCDVSVRAACLRTWSYLLHKLEASANSQLVIKSVWEPVMKVVFQVGPDNKNIYLWNFCLDLLDTLILGENQGKASLKNSIGDHSVSLKGPLRHYPISCSRWNLSQLDFFINMIENLVNRNSEPFVASEFARLETDAALRLFGSLLETVQKALRCVSISYNEVIRCLDTLFGFLERICILLDNERSYYGPHTCFKFLKVVTEKLEPSILESPLYKVGLEIKCSKKLKRATEIRCAKVPHICFMDFEDKVLPAVYVGTFYFFLVANSNLETPDNGSLLKQMEDYFKTLLSSCDTWEVLCTFTYLLYKNTTFNSISIWIVLVNRLKECLNSNDYCFVADSTSSAVVLHLLSYPFALWSWSPIKLKPHIVIEAWTSLYVSVNQASQSHNAAESFSGDLCAILNEYICQIALEFGTGTEVQLEEENCCGGFSLLCGDVITCVLKELTLSFNSKVRHCVDCNGRKPVVVNCMNIAAWFMKLFRTCKRKKDPSHLSQASRFLSALVRFIGCLSEKDDVLTFVEMISSPLLHWISETDLLDETANNQLQLLWTEMLKILQLSRPSITFDSLFLRFQQPLLEKALDHPNRAISEATINFWNSTYGAQNSLEFPKSIVPVLDKLTRNGKINICSRNRPGRYKVTNALNKSSKRVEIVGNFCCDEIYSGAKRKRLELTERQREVRRAQQGRSRDCSGHGPGIRTYTSVDFSQGIEDLSQGNDESQEIRDSY
ncbi:telomere-associated protein RIF1 [Striga asiatica]|uniref:Telomere-associated protein RIF1 n=1 Tax=Striga asiatica TaxID=4170 RepID=A0A5A7P0Q0_STRAF|nr:telomere-associated protein RIF1 [Striga asiatica]